MWFTPRNSTPDWAPALRHLTRDPALRAVIKRVGPCTLAPRRDYFIALAQAIFTQQIATSVAVVLFNRYRDLFPRRTPTPAATLALTPAQLAAVGLSRRKADYLRDLAAHFADGRLPTRRFNRMPDDAIIDALTAIHGIGRWTAEMFLIFCLNRPDVFPVDDLGIRRGIQRLHGLPDEPTPRACLPYAAAWQPYRTVATWYLWRSG